MSIFEIIMLLCFGFAWPFSIWKSFISKNNSGKSLAFLLIVLTGYISGTAHKVLFDPDPVTGLYILNGFMVIVDIAIFARNRRFAAEMSDH